MRFDMARYGEKAHHLARGVCAARTFSGFLWGFLIIFFIFFGVSRGSKVLDFFQVVGGFSLLYFVIKGGGRRRAGTFLSVLLLAYCAWYLLSAWRSVGIGDVFARALSHVSCSLLFYCAVLVVFSSEFDRKEIESGGIWVFALTVLIGVWSILDFYLLQGAAATARLRPLGEAQHPIMGMYYYAVPFFIGLVLQSYLSGWRKGLVLVGLLCLMAIFIMSGSRGPLLALVVAVAVYMAPYVRLNIILKGMAGLAVLGLLVWWLGDVSWLLRRGFSMRPDIWGAAFTGWQEYPWLGHGNTLKNIVLTRGDVSWHAHNIWLSNAYWGGVLAVSLVLLMNIRALTLLSRASGSPVFRTGLLLLVFGNVALLTDGNLLLEAPDPVWFVFLLPMAMAAVLERDTVQFPLRFRAG